MVRAERGDAGSTGLNPALAHLVTHYPDGDVIEGWKAIGEAMGGRGVRAVQRLAERCAGFPVRRRATRVYVRVVDLLDWMGTEQARQERQGTS